MPQVIWQPTVAWCFFATSARISLVVMSLPSGTRRMIASTSRGEGMAQVPVPSCLRILGPMVTTLGRSLSSASFSRHDLRLYMPTRQKEMQPPSRRERRGRHREKRETPPHFLGAVLGELGA